MIKQVDSKTVLFMKGRKFVLLYDESFDGDSPCFKCAFKDNICHENQYEGLVHLCDHLQEEPSTFFVEVDL